MTLGYLHGFSQKEQDRLVKQAKFLETDVYRFIDFSKCKTLLELGCGVGAQTEILLKRFPQLTITSIDASKVQLDRARQRLRDSKVTFKHENAKALSFDSNSFDGVFICWLLEHVPNPTDVLAEAHRVLKPGGKIYCTEVLNATLFLHPYSPATLRYWFEFNDHQWTLGGDPFIGAKLGNCLLAAGYSKIEIQPLVTLNDNRSPKKRAEMVEYWSELLLSGTDSLLEAGKVTPGEVNAMGTELQALKSAADSVFFYSAVQACALKV